MSTNEEYLANGIKKAGREFWESGLSLLTLKQGFRSLIDHKVIIALIIIGDFLSLVFAQWLFETIPLLNSYSSGAIAIVNWVLLQATILLFLFVLKLDSLTAVLNPSKFVFKILATPMACLYVLVTIQSLLYDNIFFSIGQLLAVSTVLAFILLIFRLIAARLINIGLRSAFVGERVAIVGNTTAARGFIQHVQNCPSNAWWKIVGIFDDEATSDLPHYPNMGNLDNLIECCRKETIHQIVVALPWEELKRIKAVNKRLSILPSALFITYPDILPNGCHSIKVGSEMGLPAINIQKNPLSGYSAIIKWIEDKLIAIPVALVATPCLILIAIAIRLESKGPVLFYQYRYGFNNRPFKIYKFRTMQVMENGITQFSQAVKNDTRITRIGKLLRKSSLDELPQIINVLRGEMSLVGPRPHPIALNDHFRTLIPQFDARQTVKPGITGLAQINGYRGETSTTEAMRKRVQYDMQYIENRSLWLDIKIILLTAFKCWRDKNAY